ncbi:MAG: L-serine ammonia-lyase, iron-sulfur-dependent, subunit alpha [Lachnospiraceae bacterium]|nr:L-serine ammonia-lyase, iron-sulfur-dependent, subunit alpha [Lachnospiraceae bacterium]
MIQFYTAAQLLSLCKDMNIPISEAMTLREIDLMETNLETIKRRMAHSWDIMKEAVREGREGGFRSMGGLIGGEAAKMKTHREEAGAVCGDMVSKAASYAMGVLEVNASMGLIVAAPTAGSSGVIPGVFCALQETYGFADEQMVEALMNAGAIGYLAMQNATVAGAEGGCQAEIGVAAAMAASAAVELMGGTPEQSLSAAGGTLATMLGLVCDPIGGLVEAPCQKRNATGAANALVNAEMALSGVQTLIPFDEMLQVMYRVGRSIPYELRETALGGIASAPTACELCKNGAACKK